MASAADPLLDDMVLIANPPAIEAYASEPVSQQLNNLEQALAAFQSPVVAPRTPTLHQEEEKEVVHTL